MDLPSAIVSHLEKTENRRLQAYVDTLVNQNMKLTNDHSVMGFIYNGLPYRHSTAPSGKLAWKAPHMELVSKVEDMLDNISRTKTDMQLIKQVLANLCRPCVSQQDLRDVLPECLIFVLDDAGQKLERTRAEAWTIQDNPRAMRQYQKILPKIHFYANARLIY